MECSICFNEINSGTGKVELSCSHPYHLSCLTKWFDKQKLDGSCESCPLCRHEANEFEKMPELLEEDDDDDDDDDETMEYEEPTLEELAAQERARGRFYKLKSEKTENEIQTYAATLIKACWRGYQDRLLYLELDANKIDIEFHERQALRIKNDMNDTINRGKFLKSIIGLSRTHVKKIAATKIQALWRRYAVYIVFSNGPVAQVELKGVWHKTGTMKWEKVIMNPEEDLPASIIMHPLSTVA